MFGATAVAGRIDSFGGGVAGFSGTRPPSSFNFEGSSPKEVSVERVSLELDCLSKIGCEESIGSSAGISGLSGGTGAGLILRVILSWSVSNF